MNTLDFKIVRDNAARVICHYRIVYYKFMHIKPGLLTKYDVEYMWNYYLMLRGLYNSELISSLCINRAYAMYFDVELRCNYNGN